VLARKNAGFILRRTNQILNALKFSGGKLSSYSTRSRTYNLALLGFSVMTFLHGGNEVLCLASLLFGFVVVKPDAGILRGGNNYCSKQLAASGLQSKR